MRPLRAASSMSAAFQVDMIVPESCTNHLAHCASAAAGILPSGPASTLFIKKPVRREAGQQSEAKLHDIG